MLGGGDGRGGFVGLRAGSRAECEEVETEWWKWTGGVGETGEVVSSRARIAEEEIEELVLL